MTHLQRERTEKRALLIEGLTERLLQWQKELITNQRERHKQVRLKAMGKL